MKSRLLGAIFVLIFALASLTWAATTSVVYNFTGGNDGGNPATALVFDAAGNAYGTTVVGGDFGFGTVFQLTPSNGVWTETVLYSFTGGFDGKAPHGGVTLDSQGNLYGTAVAGGDGFCTGDGCGVVFELSKSGDTWTETVIHSFTDDNKGFGPGGQVVFDQAGNLYGETPDGGKFGSGTVFQLTPTQSGWQHKVIHNFSGGNDGGVGSLGPLLVDSNGVLYGVTEIGGANSAGTVFRLKQQPDGAWRLKTLYAFQGQPDAGFPYGGLIFGGKGNLYGTTYFGGVNGMGSVYKLTRQPDGTWKEKVLYSFQGGKDGSLTTTTLLFTPTGNLLGTTSEAGNAGCSCGTIFKLHPVTGGWSESTLHRFSNSPDGAFSYYGLTPDGQGNYFGTTVQGGTFNQGAIFMLTP